MFIIAFLLFNNIFSSFTLPKKFGPRYSDFKILETEHFRIWYPNQGIENKELLQKYIKQLAIISENSYNILAKDLYNDIFLKINITVLDNSDLANGESWPLPQSNIFLYTATPNITAPIKEYKDWLWELLTHELTHAISFSTTRGYSVFLRAIMGTLITVNGVWPLNLTEGLAVYEETHFSEMGRGRSDLYKGLMLSLLDNSNNFNLGISPYYTELWPWGNIPYLYGYTVFAEFAMQDPKLPGKFSKYSAGRIPQIIDSSFKNIGGRYIEELWIDAIKNLKKWKENLYRDIEKEPTTPIRQKIKSINASRSLLNFSPDATHFAFYRKDTKNRDAIIIMETNTQKTIAKIRSVECNFIDWQGDELLYNSLEFTPWGNYFVLKSYNFKTNKTHTYPYKNILSASRIDSTHIAVVKRVLSKQVLYILDTDTGKLTKIHEPTGISSAIPLLKYNNHTIYFVEKDKKLNLYAYSLKTHQISNLFQTEHEIHSISIRHNNVYILVRANNLPNIVMIKDGKYYRLSNFKAGVDNFTLHKNHALVSYYDRAGLSIGSVRLFPAEKTFKFQEKASEPFVFKKYKYKGNNIKTHESSLFLPTLISMLPKFWAPKLSLDTSGNIILGAYTLGADPTFRNQYEFEFNKDIASSYYDFYASYTNNYFYPQLKLSYTRLYYSIDTNISSYILQLDTPFVINTDIFNTDYIYLELGAGLNYKKQKTVSASNDDLYYFTSLFISSIYRSKGAFFSTERGFSTYLEYNIKDIDNSYVYDYFKLYLPLFTHSVLQLSYNGFYSNSLASLTSIGGTPLNTLIDSSFSYFTMPGYPSGYKVAQKANSIYASLSLPLFNLLFAPNNLFPLFMKKLYFRLLYKKVFLNTEALETMGLELHFKNTIFYLVPVDITAGLYYAKNLNSYTFLFGFNLENLL